MVVGRHGDNKYGAAHATAVIDPALVAWIASWERSLRAENKSANTLHAYLRGVQAFGTFLAVEGRSADITAIRARDVEAFVLATQVGHSPYTTEAYFVAVRIFFGWLVAEEEIAASPCAKMKKPQIPESTRGAIKESAVRDLLKSCEGNTFEDRRAMAMVRLFLDTGLRLSELTILGLTDIDFRDNTAQVMGKGRRPRLVPFGRKTAAALDKYLRARIKHKHGESERLWLGERGPLNPCRMRVIIEERAAAAGLGRVHPHLLRHTFAHLWLDGGGQEGDLKAIGGWRSDVMQRYGKNLAADRAREAHKRHSPGDRF